MDSNEITGIVLSGGKGSRLGEEKGLALFNGKPLISYSIKTIQPYCEKIFISANNQIDDYGAFGYEVIEDNIKEIGPIGGLLSCIERSDTQYNFIISCDTPFVPGELFPFLLSSIENLQVGVPVHHSNLLEPLCAVYATNVIWQLRKHIEQNNYKLADFFNSVNTKKIKIHDQLPFFHEEMFMNMNSPQDFQNMAMND